MLGTDPDPIYKKMIYKNRALSGHKNSELCTYVHMKEKSRIRIFSEWSSFRNTDNVEVENLQNSVLATKFDI